MGVDLGRDARVINTREQVVRRVRSIIEAERDAMRANEVRAHVAVGDQAQPEDRVSQEARLELHLSKIAARAASRRSALGSGCALRNSANDITVPAPSSCGKETSAALAKRRFCRKRC